MFKKIRNLTCYKKFAGIDMDNNGARALVLGRGKKNNYHVLAYADISAPCNSKNEKLEVLEKLMLSLPKSVKNVAIALPSSKTIVKTLYLDEVLNATKMRDFIAFNAEKYLGFSLNDVNVDYQVFHRDESCVKKIGVNIVAAKKEQISNQIDLYENFGLKVRYIDVDIYALIRGIVRDKSLGDEVWAVLNVDYSRLIISIFCREKILYSHADYFINRNESSMVKIQDEIFENLQRGFLSCKRKIKKIFLCGNLAEKIDFFKNESLSEFTDEKNLELKNYLAFHDLDIEIASGIDQSLWRDFSSGAIISLGLAMRNLDHGSNKSFAVA